MPDPWECDDEAEVVAAPQHINELVTKLHSKEESSSRWSSPKCNEKLNKIRQHGIPKQTDWAVSVWVQWACYRCEKIIVGCLALFCKLGHCCSCLMYYFMEFL